MSQTLRRVAVIGGVRTPFCRSTCTVYGRSTASPITARTSSRANRRPVRCFTACVSATLSTGNRSRHGSPVSGTSSQYTARMAAT